MKKAFSVLKVSLFAVLAVSFVITNTIILIKLAAFHDPIRE